MPFSGMVVQRLFLTVWVMFFMGSAQAEENPNELCESLSLMAKSIMRARQSGVEMSMLINETDHKGSKILNKVSKVYIANAYDYPRVRDENVKKDVILEFGSRIYLACYKAQRKLLP